MKATKFEFSDFSIPKPLDTEKNVAQEQAAVIEKPILYTQQELVEKENSAYQKGVADGKEQQKTLDKMFEQDVLELLQGLNAKLYDVKSDINYEEQKLMASLAELSVAIAETLGKEVSPEQDTEVVLNFIKQHKNILINAPEIKIYVAPGIKSYLEPKVNELFTQHLADKLLHIEADPSLKTKDCMIGLQELTLSNTTKENKEFIIQTLKKHLAIDEQAILSQDEAITESPKEESNESGERSSE